MKQYAYLMLMICVFAPHVTISMAKDGKGEEDHLLAAQQEKHLRKQDEKKPQPCQSIKQLHEATNRDYHTVILRNLTPVDFTFMGPKPDRTDPKQKNIKRLAVTVPAAQERTVVILRGLVCFYKMKNQKFTNYATNKVKVIPLKKLKKDRLIFGRNKDDGIVCGIYNENE